MNRKPLIRKFLSDQCSEEEAKQVLAWWQEDHSVLDELISEEDWIAYIHQEKKENNRRIGTGLKVLIYFLLIGLVAVLFQLRNSVLTTSSPQTFTTPSFQIYYNPLAHSKEYTLSDNSQVSLQPGAMIQVNIQPGQELRHVRVLQGKTFFKVASDASRPFVVQTQAIKTTALGTEFSVDYDGDKEWVLIKLIEGKIRVEQARGLDRPQTKILTSGQQVESSAFSTMEQSRFASKEESKQPKNGFKTQNAASKHFVYFCPPSIHNSEDWLVLDETSLSDIIEYIQHELDNPVAYDSSMLQNYRIKGRFRKNTHMTILDKDQLAASILQLIVEMNPFELDKKYNTYILKPKK